MTTRRAARSLVLLSCLAGGLPLTARAETPDARLGVRVGYDRAVHDPYVGAELHMPLDRSWALDGNVEYVHLPDRQHFTINLDVHYSFNVHRAWFAWVGAGLGLLSDDPNGPRDGETRDGVGNLLVGVGYETAVVPYLQLRWSGHRAGRFSFGVGVRF
jgi:hypothetical protein